MVRDAVWQAARMTDGYLCIGCLEKRLGREPTPDDFTAAPVNFASKWDTARLATRRRRTMDSADIEMMVVDVLTDHLAPGYREAALEWLATRLAAYHVMAEAGLIDPEA
jgi:hypothetical protein